MKFLNVITLMSLILPGLSYAGSEGKGGGALRCRGNEIDTLLLYDLYEAKLPGELSEKGLTINWNGHSNESTETQIEGALKRVEILLPGLIAEVRFELEVAKSIRVPVPRGNKIPAPTDINPDYLPENCWIVGLGMYNDKKKRLTVDDNYYNNIGSTQQAAFWIHEAVYKVLRTTQNAPDSWAARRIVAYVFSTLTDDELKYVPRLTESNVSKVSTALNVHALFLPEISNQFYVSAELKTKSAECSLDIGVSLGAGFQRAKDEPDYGKTWGMNLSGELTPIKVKGPFLTHDLGMNYFFKSWRMHGNSSQAFSCTYELSFYDSSKVKFASQLIQMGPCQEGCRKYVLYLDFDRPDWEDTK